MKKKIQNKSSNDSVQLTNEEKNQITTARVKIDNQKTIVADLQVEALNATRRLADLQTDLMKKAVEIAKAHNLNVDEPEKEQWNLDTNSMSFVRIK